MLINKVKKRGASANFECRPHARIVPWCIRRISTLVEHRLAWRGLLSQSQAAPTGAPDKFPRRDQDQP
ncbi:putative 3-hydroxybutyryl-CoA dehydrogenase [Fusarium oxysporum f. sp. albedinis]|nr:putative 3-hydroxybutyryl-CoA dehydrogenase [Fusarium oxysporum f. sp. albedinis]